MAMQYEATLRLKGDDQTAEAFRSASEASRRFADQQTRATRGFARMSIRSAGRFAVCAARRWSAVSPACSPKR